MPELPFEIWKERVTNEINTIQNLETVEKDSIKWNDKNVELWINITALGYSYSIEDGEIRLKPKKTHQVFIKINRSFPYPGGIDFSWHTSIFHPNIHPVEIDGTTSRGTGYICLNILRQWSKLTDLETTIESLKNLVENPNHQDPLQYDICMQAAEYFRKTRKKRGKI